MSYQALYRVWRPQRFQDIAGQEAVTRTLRNALVQQKNSHAYLFTGPRGTGKTSAAKIFAKAINCPNQVDGEPCNDCEICEAITKGRLNDVIEIDAASNNGVEEIRDIRDKARYAPTQAAYKIYIIDEVHMLSTGAFNALLKTLEEPPPNVIFILATTEPHKIPLTIISRTQRFDFKRISTTAILERMRYILDEEGITYEAEALTVVARAANGGMRDALSLLDQVIAYDPTLVSEEHARIVSGSVTEEMMLDFLEAASTQQPDQALRTLSAILAEGKEAGRLIEELILFSRDLLLAQQTKGNTEGSERFQQFAKRVPATFLFEAIAQFNQTQNEMRFSTQPDVYVEVVAVKLSQPLVVETTSAAPSQQVTQLEQELTTLRQEMVNMRKSIQENGTNEASVKPTAPPKRSNGQRTNGFAPDYAKAQSVLRGAVKQELLLVKDHWVDILDVLSVTHRAVLRQAEPVAATEEAIILSFEYEMLCQKACEDEELRKALAAAIERMIQRPGEVVCVTATQWGQLKRSYMEDLRAGKLPVRKVEPVEATGEQSASEEPAPPMEFVLDEPLEEDDNEIVEQAVSLFGEEHVTVINE